MGTATVRQPLPSGCLAVPHCECSLFFLRVHLSSCHADNPLTTDKQISEHSVPRSAKPTDHHGHRPPDPRSSIPPPHRRRDCDDFLHRPLGRSSRWIQHLAAAAALWTARARGGSRTSTTKRLVFAVVA